LDRKIYLALLQMDQMKPGIQNHDEIRWELF